MGYTLTRQDVQETLVGERTAWSLVLTVTTDDEEAFPAKVFVYQAENPADPETRGWFTAVASPAQLLEYPEDAPANESGELQQPYYRLSTLTMVSRNASQLEDLTDQVMEELDLLARNLVALTLLETGEIVGTAP